MPVLLDLFITFFLIGLFTFGGGYAMIPLIQGQVVIEKAWIGEDLFWNLVAISEVTPGPFAINIATFVGTQVSGPLGGAIATFGVILPSFIIILLLASILAKFANNKYFKGAIEGVKPVVVALISSTLIVLMVKVFFFQGGSFENTAIFDRKVLSLFLTILGLNILVKKKLKKNVGAIPMLLFSALCGILVFI